jgi:hypothetical protein
MYEMHCNKTSISPSNEKGQAHGHWVMYYSHTNNFWFECHYVNGVEYGYEKWGNGQKFYHAI